MVLRDKIRALRFYYKGNSRELYRRAFADHRKALWFPFLGRGEFTPRNGMQDVAVPREHWSSLTTAARLVLMNAYPVWSQETLTISFGRFTFRQPAGEKWTPQGMFVDDGWRIRNRDFHGKVVVDVGAFIGDSSIAYAAQGAKVHAFEAVPTFARYVAENARLNGLEDHIVVHTVALSDRNEVIRSSTAIKNLASMGHGCLPGEDALQEVRLVDALSYLRGNGINGVDVLKMNCEGCEYELLHDGRLLDELQPTEVALEYHRGGEPIAHLLEAHDYKVDWPVRSYPKGLIFAHRA